MRTLTLILLITLGAWSPLLAQDPRAFAFHFPEEWITLVVRNAVRDKHVKIRGADRRVPIDELTIAFEPGRKLGFTLRTDIETVRELAKTESTAVGKALSKWLERRSDEYFLKFRFAGKLSVEAPAALVITFHQSDVALELHRGDQLIATAPSPLERLGLWLLDRHLRTIHVAESLKIETQLHWLWQDHWLYATGHRIVARFYLDRFPFPPFRLEDTGLSTESHVLTLTGRRD